MTHHLTFNCTRHICISKTVSNYFQTDDSTAQGCWLICLRQCETCCSFSPLFSPSLFLESCNLINCRFKCHLQHKTDNLHALAKCTILFFCYSRCSVSASKTQVPGFRWSKAPSNLPSSFSPSLGSILIYLPFVPDSPPFTAPSFRLSLRSVPHP